MAKADALNVRRGNGENNPFNPAAALLEIDNTIRTAQAPHTCLTKSIKDFDAHSQMSA
jgi:hypothetical protein